MPEHIMLDLETMGTRPGALLLSIGAVRFNPWGRELGEKFHVGIEMQSAHASGMTIEASTLQWWMHDDRQPARTALEALEKIDLFTALEGFSMWCAEAPFDAIWGNSAAFDCGLLKAAYELTGIETPWKFWHERCYRTLRGVAPEVSIPATEGVAHDALADAVRQAAHTQAIYRAFGFAR